MDDLAGAAVYMMRHYDGEDIVNIGVGDDVSIGELAALVGRVVGYSGDIVFDTDKPDGTPRKLLDVSRATALGWSAQIPLERGVAETYDWFREHEDQVREA